MRRMFSADLDDRCGGGIGWKVGHVMGMPLMVVTGSRGSFSDCLGYDVDLDSLGMVLCCVVKNVVVNMYYE